MVCSPEQRAANRKNSRRSTGPKTPEGKAASRRNGLKHGLTGAGVVVLGEDVAAVEERFEAFQADLKPANDVARFLVNRAALLSVRLDRAAREEAARISRDMIEAEALEEDARAEEFERLTAHFNEHPGESVRKLRRSAEGIDWLIAAWRGARRNLTAEGSLGWQVETIVRLGGHKPEAMGRMRAWALDRARAGNFALLDPTDWPDLEPAARKAAAKAALVTMIDAAIADLAATREALDPAQPEQIRAGAAARALFDASKPANLARKYEATNERNFYRALREVEAINATAEEPVKIAGTEEPATGCDEMASSFPAPVARFELPTGRDRRDEPTWNPVEQGRFIVAASPARSSMATT